MIQPATTPSAATMSLAEAASRARQALSDSPIYLIRQIDVESNEDGLLLTGKVDSFYHKQVAQETVRAATQGAIVSNSVAVVWP